MGAATAGPAGGWRAARLGCVEKALSSPPAQRWPAKCLEGSSSPLRLKGLGLTQMSVGNRVY